MELTLKCCDQPGTARAASKRPVNADFQQFCLVSNMAGTAPADDLPGGNDYQ